MEKIYVAIIGTGEHSDYYENSIFCSENKEMVENWVNKFNNLIEKNNNRIYNYDIDNDNDVPLWYDFINYECPTALMRETELR